MDITNKNCEPCKHGGNPLPANEIKDYLECIKNWFLIEGNTKIKKEFKFKDFKTALNFTNNIGNMAEQQGHHPDIKLGYGYVNIIWYTHTIGGLHDNDFICASKTDQIFFNFL